VLDLNPDLSSDLPILSQGLPAVSWEGLPAINWADWRDYPLADWHRVYVY